MFKYIGGDFPPLTVYIGGQLSWGLNSEQKYSLKGKIDNIIILPEKNKKIISFECHLKDGKKFIADTDANTFQKISLDKISTEEVTVNGNTVNYQAKPPSKGKGCLVAIAVLVVIGVIMAVVSGGAGATPLTKEEASQLDKNTWNIVINTINTNNELMKGMTGYADGTITELDLYNYCNDTENYMRELSQSYPSSGDKGAQKYIKSCEDYNLMVQMVASSLKKYVESKNIADLSAVQESISNATEAITIVSGNRAVFLGLSGYSEEEIKALADDIEGQIVE